MEEVEALLRHTREAAQSRGLFGGARAVWLRALNFVADTPTGRAEGTLEVLEELKEILQKADGKELRVLVSASPVDKRLSFFKWLQSNGQAQEVSGYDALEPESLNQIAKAKGLRFEPEAAEWFLKKVGNSARALEGELEKLSLYLAASAGNSQTVKVEYVLGVTSACVEGEFFEPVEAFYSRRVDWALRALKDYYTLQKNADARPLLATFFNRNRLLLLIKAAEAGGYARIGARGLSWTAKGETMKTRMGSEKTPFNLFAQHPFYLGKLVQEAQRFSLEELQIIQRELLNVFEKIHEHEQESVLEAFMVRCAK